MKNSSLSINVPSVCELLNQQCTKLQLFTNVSLTFTIKTMKSLKSAECLQHYSCCCDGNQWSTDTVPSFPRMLTVTQNILKYSTPVQNQLTRNLYSQAALVYSFCEQVLNILLHLCEIFYFIILYKCIYLYYLRSDRCLKCGHLSDCK